eukprot:7087923-Prymnesium_polylepis.1
MLVALAVMVAGFMPPPMSGLTRPMAVHTIVMEEMWTPPKDLGPLPDLGGLYASDVQFMDVEGDEITLRGKGGGVVEFWNNGKGRMRSAKLRLSGNSIQISGEIKKPVPIFSMIGFNMA